MNKNIFLTKYFLKYYDTNERTYYFPKPLYDDNGYIDEETLTLTLNKVSKIIKSREINIILLDPTSYNLNIKMGEPLEDVSMYIDSSKFKILKYSGQDSSVFNVDIKSINVISEVGRDINLKINLYTFFD